MWVSRMAQKIGARKGVKIRTRRPRRKRKMMRKIHRKTRRLARGPVFDGGTDSSMTFKSSMAFNRHVPGGEDPLFPSIVATVHRRQQIASDVRTGRGSC